MNRDFFYNLLSRMGLNLINLLFAILLILSISCFLKAAPAADFAANDKSAVVGNWQGSLDVMGKKLRIIFKVSEAGADSLTALLDSPDQGAKDIPVSTVIINDDSVFFDVKVAAGHFTGKPDFVNNKIDGTWYQSGMKFPLVLEKVEKIEEVRRPQEPKAPFPYNEEEVTFENKDAGITLAGTFTCPKEGSNFPAVVLVTGSGPQNRNEELLGHKPFLVWADHLTKNGFAVLRFDDRGVGKSTGNFGTAITQDFASDAIAAVEFLKNKKEVNPRKIGIIGHSEGGLIAPIAANKCSDVAFIVLAAGPAVPGKDIIMKQTEVISRVEGVTEEDIKKQIEYYSEVIPVIINAKDAAEARTEVEKVNTVFLSKLTEEEKKKPDYSPEMINQATNQITSPWFKYFLSYDPRPELEKLKIPVLSLFCENDLHVVPSQNQDEMEKALKKSRSKNYKIFLLPKLNHLFQESTTGAPSKYGKIEQTASPEMLDTMTNWLKEVTK